jgi:hypothetical protein
MQQYGFVVPGNPSDQADFPVMLHCGSRNQLSAAETRPRAFSSTLKQPPAVALAATSQFGACVTTNGTATSASAYPALSAVGVEHSNGMQLPAWRRQRCAWRVGPACVHCQLEPRSRKVGRRLAARLQGLVVAPLEVPIRTNSQRLLLRKSRITAVLERLLHQQQPQPQSAFGRSKGATHGSADGVGGGGIASNPDGTHGGVCSNQLPAQQFLPFLSQEARSRRLQAASACIGDTYGCR